MMKLRSTGTKFGMQCAVDVLNADKPGELGKIISNATWELLPFVECFMRLMCVGVNSITISCTYPEVEATVVIETEKLGRVKVQGPTIEKAILQLQALKEFKP